MKRCVKAVGIGMGLGLAIVLTSCMVFNSPPVAEFDFDPPGGWAPLEVLFDASASFDPDGHITAYDWEFGDGATDSGAQVSHIYHQPGTYTVRFHAIDEDGDFSTKTATLVVDDPPVEIVSQWPLYGWFSTMMNVTARNATHEKLAFAEIIVIFLDAAGKEVDRGMHREENIWPGDHWMFTITSNLSGSTVDSMIVILDAVEFDRP